MNRVVSDVYTRYVNGESVFDRKLGGTAEYSSLACDVQGIFYVCSKEIACLQEYLRIAGIIFS